MVSHVTAMGGADILADGSIQMSIDGSNNKFDPAAASFVYRLYPITLTLTLTRTRTRTLTLTQP